MAGRRVGVIFSGGNIERGRVLQVLGGSTPAATCVYCGAILELVRSLERRHAAVVRGR
jgi:hypothetical protein